MKPTPRGVARLETNIAGETGRLQRIVEGVLNLARAENRGRLDEVEDIALADLVRDVLDTRAERLAAKGLTADADLHPLPRPAAAFCCARPWPTCSTTPSISARPAAAWHSVWRGLTARVCLCIRDQGPGIPDYALPRLFERFYSVPRPDTGERSSGLGLNLVQEVARLHQGTIELRNLPAGGAEARLCLPATKLT